MARNIEIKASVTNLDSLRVRVQGIADQGPLFLEQDDTFFACPNGRMKLRVFGNGEGDLIFYQRADQSEAKESFYHIYHTNDPDVLRENLSHAYGQTGRVRKHREVWMAGRTRIHLDRVGGLGDFMELEVVLHDGETAEQGVKEAASLRAQLGIDDVHLINVAYVDLLSRDSVQATHATCGKRIES